MLGKDSTNEATAQSSFDLLKVTSKLGMVAEAEFQERPAWDTLSPRLAWAVF